MVGRPPLIRQAIRTVARERSRAGHPKPSVTPTRRPLSQHLLFLHRVFVDQSLARVLSIELAGKQAEPIQVRRESNRFADRQQVEGFHVTRFECGENSIDRY